MQTYSVLIQKFKQASCVFGMNRDERWRSWLHMQDALESLKLSVLQNVHVPSLLVPSFSCVDS